MTPPPLKKSLISPIENFNNYHLLGLEQTTTTVYSSTWNYQGNSITKYNYYSKSQINDLCVTKTWCTSFNARWWCLGLSMQKPRQELQRLASAPGGGFWRTGRHMPQHGAEVGNVRNGRRCRQLGLRSTRPRMVIWASNVSATVIVTHTLNHPGRVTTLQRVQCITLPLNLIIETDNAVQSEIYLIKRI